MQRTLSLCSFEDSKEVAIQKPLQRLFAHHPVSTGHHKIMAASRAAATLAIWITSLAVSGWAYEGRPEHRMLATAPGDLEDRLLQDAADGSLDDFSLVEAAIVAGGLTDRPPLRQLHETFHNHERRCQAEVGPMSTPLEKTAAAFRFLHEQILTGTYVSDASDVAGTLTTGNYNCLSATILFQALCQSARLPVEPVWNPAHVASCVDAPICLRVETTIVDWDAAAHTTDRSQAEESRRLTDVQLIAKVYYNRGIELMARGRHATAFRVAKTGYLLDQQDTAARNNLLACINNWALSLCRLHQYEQARTLLSTGRQLAPSYLPFQQNEEYVVRHWEESLRRDDIITMPQPTSP